MTPPLQAKELLDHLEDVLSNKPVEVISGNTIVEAKPQVSRGGGGHSRPTAIGHTPAAALHQQNYRQLAAYPLHVA
jgi:trehalose 6-phosphate synthase/phosphatase